MSRWSTSFARASHVLTTIDQRFRRVDILILVLGAFSSFVIASAFQKKVEGSWRAQTRGSASPFQYNHKLVDPVVTERRWTLIVIGSDVRTACGELGFRESEAPIQLVILPTRATGEAIRCSPSTPVTVLPSGDRAWMSVRRAMDAAGAHSVVVNPDGQAVFSSSESQPPTPMLPVLGVSLASRRDSAISR
jgi:hypothetical protein